MLLRCSLLTALCSIITFVCGSDPQQKTLTPDPETNKVHRVAIIGAGAAGSSTAYYLDQFIKTSKSNITPDITIFETNDRVGGRTTTINALDDPRYPTELGASIFVEVNQILYNATRDFGLDTKERRQWSTGSKYDLGVWDGTQFVFTVTNDDGASSGGWWKGYWDIAKLLWKYGISPIRVQRTTTDVVGRFLRMYTDFFPFASLDQAVIDTGLGEFVGKSGRQALFDAGVSEAFSTELVQASTRVNYAQNLGGIHGLETFVCMAIQGAMAVEGGNWQIFDQAVKRSSAKLLLNTSVIAVERMETGEYSISAETMTETKNLEFDTVVLAAPYQFANITFFPTLGTPPEAIEYVKLHVTLFTSPHRPSAAFFGVETQDEVPDSILTTLPPGIDLGESRGRAALGLTKFWSFSTLRALEPSLDDCPATMSDEDLIQASCQTTNITERQYLYKIFSPDSISASFIRDLFALDFPADHSDIEDEKINFEPISHLSTQDISWHYTKIWNSYPYLPPRLKFDSFKLDENIYYTSPMEAFISTMETSALSGRNVARLIVDRL